MAISKKYRSYGLRRLNNLSDINDPEQALNNLLNDLQPRDGESFISQDLDATRGLKDTEVYPSTFIQLASSTPTYTFANTLGPQEDFVRPFIRLQDRFNTYRAVTGDPGILGSGMGPDAWAVPVSSINPSPNKGDTINSIIPTFDTSKDNLVQKGDFWTLGEFYQSYKFDPSFEDKNGGVVWEGYITPNYYDTSSTYTFETTGLFHFEVDRFDTGEWEVLRSIYSPTRTVKVGANTTTNVVQLATGDGKYVAVGDKLSTNNEIVVDNIAGDVLTLTGDVTFVSNSDITFTFIEGEDYITGSFNTEPIYDLGEHFKTRILWWYPNTAPDVDDKYLRMNSTASRVLLFSTFSNTSPTSTPNSQELIDTVNKAVTGYQRSFGDTGSYKTFLSGGIVKSSYTPKSDFASINVLGSNTSITASLTEGRMFMSSGSALLESTSIGNLLIDTTPTFDTIQKFTQIKRLPTNSGQSRIRVISKPLLQTASIPVKVVDHNGLMDYFVTTTSGTSVNVEDTSNIRKGMVCITYYTSPSTFTTITDVVNSTSFSTSSPLGLNSNNYVFVYADSGLIDSSKDVFCAGVVGKLLTTPATSGSNVLTVSSNTDLAIDMRVQYTGGIEPDSNITITAIGGNQVTLSSTTTGDIDAGATITFAPQSSTGDKQQCVIPLDLSPPFSGVEYGLDTNGKRIVGTPSANLDIAVLSLSSNTSAVSSANTTDVFDAQITVNGIYRIKARQIP